MKLLLSYLRHYRGLVLVALVLATVNQVFSLLDPLIFRYVIDNYATRFSEYTTGEFFREWGLPGSRFTPTDDPMTTSTTSITSTTRQGGEPA